MAAIAFCAAAGVAPVPKGLPIATVAMPQVAIAQLGSCASTSAKASSASFHQKECSSATARCNSGCAEAAHELSNETMPSFCSACAEAAPPLRAKAHMAIRLVPSGDMYAL